MQPLTLRKCVRIKMRRLVNIEQWANRLEAAI
jgi:hypothetical protein